MKARILDVKEVGRDYRVTIETKTLWFKPEVKTLQGSCTVWNYYPSGRSASTMMESLMYDLMKGWKMWQQDAEMAKV